MVIRSKHLPYIAIPASAISILLLIFFLGPNNGGSFFTVNDNNVSNNQDRDNAQPNGEKEINDYSLRGAISSTSGGKQVLEKYQTHLCGATFEKRTDFIQEYTLPFPCSQPVGITVQEQNSSNSGNNNNSTANAQKIWIAATWVGYLVVFDPEQQYFSEFQQMAAIRLQ